MSVSVDAQSGDLLSRVVSWWDTLGRKPNDPVEGLGVPLSAKCLFLFGWRSPLGSANIFNLLVISDCASVPAVSRRQFALRSNNFFVE
jgi:hypothetical protein